MDADLLIPATAALLDGWVGPLVYVGLDGDDLAGCVQTGRTLSGRIRVSSLPGDHLPGVSLTCGVEELRLELSRAECRDRVARVLWAACDETRDVLPIGAPGLIYCPDGVWSLGADIGGGSVAFATFSPAEGGEGDVAVPALATLDPHDDTRLPDGSRRVDALALAIVAREVLRG